MQTTQCQQTTGRSDPAGQESALTLPGTDQARPWQAAKGKKGQIWLLLQLPLTLERLVGATGDNVSPSQAETHALEPAATIPALTDTYTAAERLQDSQLRCLCFKTA